MDAEEETVPPPYVLEDVAAPAGSALSLRVSDFSFDPTYSHGLHLGRAPQLRPGLFVGRDAELKRLSRLLLPGSSTRNSVAIAAVGGLGKTQLAITYAERYHHRYSSVFWLDAKDESTLKQELAGLADIVLHQGQSAAATSVDAENVIKQTKQWFSFPNNDRWLLILDNYDDPRLPGLNSATGYDIRSFFPSRNQGSILITTRSKKLSFAQCLELRKLEEIEQSLKILSLRSGLDLAQNTDANTLATRLAGFPLALATAGAYLGQSSSECSVQEYLTLYDQQWDELQANADHLFEYEDRTLFSTWNLSLEQVRQQHSVAAEFMCFLAYFGNSGLNYGLFRSARDRGFEYRTDWLNALTESKIMFNKTVATLHNYSLLEYSPQGYSLHTCVHDWTLKVLNKDIEPAYYWDAMLCIAASVRHNYKKDSWENNQSLVQHVTQLRRVQLQRPSMEDVYDEDQAYSLNWTGALWHKQAKFDEAEVLLSSALRAYENLYGNGDRKTLNVMVDLADTYENMDRHTEAENLYRQALKSCENISVPEDRLVARSRHNLALLYLKREELAEAELLLRQVLASDEKYRGRESEWTMVTASNLAYALSRRGKFLEADALSQRALEGLRKSLGPDHPLTLSAMDRRADACFGQEQWEQAEMLYSKVLEGRYRVLGRSHAKTLAVVRDLAGVYAKQNKPDKLSKLTESYGDTALYLFWLLGHLYTANGDDGKAIVAFRQMYRDRNGVLSWGGAFCDVCQSKEDLVTATMGLFVCRICDDILLCYQCGEQHRAGLKTFEHCAGHPFLGIPAEVLLGSLDQTKTLDREQ